MSSGMKNILDWETEQQQIKRFIENKGAVVFHLWVLFKERINFLGNRKIICLSQSMRISKYNSIKRTSLIFLNELKIERNRNRRNQIYFAIYFSTDWDTSSYYLNRKTRKKWYLFRSNRNWWRKYIQAIQ